MAYDMAMLPDEHRELTTEEIESVDGGLIWFAVGFVVGAIVVGGAYLIAEANDTPETTTTTK